MTIAEYIDASGNVVRVTPTTPLPTSSTTSGGEAGATEAKQDTQITSLQLIDDVVGSKAAGTAAASSFLGGGVYNSALPAPTNGQQVALQLSPNGGLMVGGWWGDDAAMGGAVSYPMPVGGVYNSTPPTYTTGDRAQIQQDARGSINVALRLPDSVTPPTSAAALSDAFTNTIARIQVANFSHAFNGSTWDRMRGDSANGLLVQEPSEYETVAASATDQALGATGAAGDYFKGLLIIPATIAAGTVSIKDGAGSAINVFVTGTLPSLAPIYVPLGLKSTGGAWSVTTGANVSAIAMGNFT
jgi:hypothetical protein